LAASYADIAATSMGLMADQAETKTSAKYADFTAAYLPAHCGGEPGTDQCFSTGFHQ